MFFHKKILRRGDFLYATYPECIKMGTKLNCVNNLFKVIFNFKEHNRLRHLQYVFSPVLIKMQKITKLNNKNNGFKSSNFSQNLKRGISFSSKTQLHKPFYIWLQTTGLFLTNKWLKMHYAF